MAFGGLKKLCTPAYVYLVISVITVIVMAYQNFNYRGVYCMGLYKCDISSSSVNIFFIFLFKALYIAFWTWILNLMCGQGYESLSWFLVLIPLIVFFIIIAKGMITMD
jgi:hypothetical protein